ncbi:MAG: hypothetical protein ACD_51C00181G0003 [uncultured bacterium]|nr:MAG: hypothetical protein ACD_51C00181G0003 [uncultured bacterium]OGJ47501.1 MAG: hypothetical protein A2244_01945 [Candidatus Peregrinibacteria bacterium RIFOXYA2_FULL_41_18]OGJ49499.1 MAG: hypothetical protein A2344_04425 [Candidatus Peregrinibacteria bacterium RIFOXYB12_FULL_41_12]OGJ53560.1 MAG: hypothetical protein A2448_03955 [Candidatus Peregrinibacteria bacterium RIFOXYC2_FULL_41_22]OGJ54274.1 MAG: hypothetical protein A2336_05130 [Candidatus Peregrinibacteria bacterium RIFOXYB2_FULL
MSDFESLGAESSEGGAASAEAVEKLREQMKKASAAIKAIQREEGKQKKKEDKLAALLVKLIKSAGGATSGVLALIVQLLNENIPAGFILAILILGKEDLKKEAGEDLMLKSDYDDPEQKMLEGKKGDLTKEERKIFKKKEQEMEDLEDTEVLSPKIREELNEWGEMILAAGLSSPHKTIGTVLDEERKIKAPAVQLATFSLRDYFTTHGLEYDYDDMWEFSAAVLRSVMVKIDKAAKHVKKEVLPAGF